MARLKTLRLTKSGIKCKRIENQSQVNRVGIDTHFAQLRARNLPVQHIHEEQRDALLPRAYLHGKHDNNSVANAQQTLR